MKNISLKSLIAVVALAASLAACATAPNNVGQSEPHLNAAAISGGH